MKCSFCEKVVKGRWRFCDNKCVMDFNKRVSSEANALKKQSEVLDLAFDNLSKARQLIIEREKMGLWSVDDTKIVI